MKKSILCLLVLAIFTLLASTTVFAENTAKIKEVKTLANQAVDYLQKGGNLSEINNKSGKFVKGNLYVFVYDCQKKGVILAAHPYLANKLVGKDISLIKDKKGKFFCLSLCKQVKSNPNGVWGNYYWINSKTHKIEEKFTYIKQVPGKPYQVCVGAYKSDLGNITLDTLNKKYK